MDKTPLLFALGALLLAGCGLNGDAGYQAGYAARLAGDDDKAFAYYLNAARSDDYPEARLEVADMYLQGRGTRQDTGQAISWFRQLANADDPQWSRQAHRQLGLIYRGDYGAEYRNRRKAADHFRRCADQGDADCGRLLALLTPPSLRVVAAGSQSVASGLPAVDIYARHAASVYKIVVYEQLGADFEPLSVGSAIAIDSYRAITSYHLLQAGGVPVSIDSSPDGGTVQESDVQVWQVARVDPRRDLALLTLAEPVRPLNFTDTMASFDRVRVGEKVFAIGAPAGLDKTLTEGIVSARRTENGVRLIQTTAPVTYGSSGGALFNTEGNLIGMTVKGVQAGGNFNFALAMDEVQAFLAE
ncbi:trypsin-like peptidase domain-containing protein [uncultured Oceanisphaera sp.]|uniref:trypsin-like peptidase domain-containing protein n=1 Tax=uncultured Oceanisphaera sp. TaxID=353858 RepID=UPI00260DA9D0|nr:trypsin-like peptidase domain-containing protein [uncultured Oceanisphaera sp.]